MWQTPALVDDDWWVQQYVEVAEALIDVLDGSARDAAPPDATTRATMAAIMPRESSWPARRSRMIMSYP